MCIPISARTWCLWPFMVLLFLVSATAGELHHDCRKPMVFPGAAVNVVVLPYRYAGGSTSSLSTMSDRLSLLVKLNVLSNILEYGSVGAVQMEMPQGASRNDPSCQPEFVLPKLLGKMPGADQQLASGHGLVFVWGLLYEEGDDVFVQTYARFLRRDIEEVVTFNTAGVSFSARPSSQLLAFVPQKLSRQQLEKIENSYRKADFIHKEPTDDSPGEPLPELVAKCAGCDDSPVHAGFYVEEKKGEWIRIQWMDPVRQQNKQGWIHAAGSLEGIPLDQILPELKFIEGCVGYLRQRVAEAEGKSLAGELASRAVAELNAFVQSNDLESADIASAVALQLAGIVEYASGRDRLDSLTRAAQDFEQARKLIPYDSNGISLAVSAQVSQEWKQKRRCEQTVLKAERLSAAGALSSDKTTALGNLSNLYRVMLKTATTTAEPGDLTKAEVETRLNTVQRLTASR